jgi:hypothetical protein
LWSASKLKSEILNFKNKNKNKNKVFDQAFRDFIVAKAFSSCV